MKNKLKRFLYPYLYHRFNYNDKFWKWYYRNKPQIGDIVKMRHGTDGMIIDYTVVLTGYSPWTNHFVCLNLINDILMLPLCGFLEGDSNRIISIISKSNQESRDYAKKFIIKNETAFVRHIERYLLHYIKNPPKELKNRKQ